MDPIAVLILLAALLTLGLSAFALTRRTARPGPPPRRARTPIERFWDTPEHSETWDDTSSADAGEEREGTSPRGRRPPT